MEQLNNKLSPDNCCSPGDESSGRKLSSSGVTIMSSMDNVDVQATCSTEPLHPMAEYEKPGYSRCAFVERFMETAVGPVPVIRPTLDVGDLISTFVVRCGINRYSYTVAPGLYAVGQPDETCEVLVTANFKLTFDHLRKELSNINAWILVLDTRGINVWCAAGKGTFGTAELVKRIRISQLDHIVSHRRLIVPQLGATGVSAHSVKKQSGFRVVYGPVRACDIPAFLENNRTADKIMRQVTFNLYERLILTPVELWIALKPALITALILFLLSGLGPGIFSFSTLRQRGSLGILSLVAGMVSGAVITPALLPFIPFRRFALKGIVTGIFCAALFLAAASATTMTIPGPAGWSALFLFSVTISSYLAMNFTGTTPFTSPSGVEKEMKNFIPLQLSALVISFGLWIYSAF